MKMSEAEFQDKVAELAQWSGWLVFHPRRSRTESGGHATAVAYDGKGYPDLTMVHPARGIVFAELKVPPNDRTPDQVKWGKAIMSALAERTVRADAESYTSNRTVRKIYGLHRRRQRDRPRLPDVRRSRNRRY